MSEFGESAEGHSPYRFDRSQFDAVRMEAQGVSPELQAAYAGIETYIGDKFTQLYGNFLEEDQRLYLTNVNIIIPSRNVMSNLITLFNDEGIKDQDLVKATLQGKIYRGYSIESPAQIENLDLNEDASVGTMAIQLWGGRFGAVPEVEGLENLQVDKNLLMSEDAHAERDDWFSGLAQYAATNIWGSMAIHEKTHGIQQPDIPLPFLEIDAYHREREVFRQNNWYLRNEIATSSPWALAMDYWGELLDELGADGHKFMFGNLHDVGKEAEIGKLLKSKFTEEKMLELFPKDDNGTYVEWQTEPVAA